MTCDIPGAFMQADIDEQLFLKFDGDLVELLVQVEPTYQPYITYEGRQRILYTELDKALYGMLQAALLFWQKLFIFLTEKHGFVRNEYDWCVINKIVSGKQCTVTWYVDNIKMSHKTQQVLEDLLTLLNDEFRKEAPLTITRGKIHDYLGMVIDYTVPGKVKFMMKDFIQGVLVGGCIICRSPGHEEPHWCDRQPGWGLSLLAIFKTTDQHPKLNGS